MRINKGDAGLLNVRLICVGKLKEKFYRDAMEEYMKRLSAYCRFECVELRENNLPESPSEKEIASSLDGEAELITKNIQPGAYVVAMCVEGKKLDSKGVATLIRERENSGKPKLCFIIGGSYGISEKIKQMADFRLSMSDMTFPHHLARVMLTEQIYRGFKINEGSAYHK